MLTAVPLPSAAHEEISTILSGSEAALFGRFSLSDQWHSYQVLCTLQSAGHTHPDLLTAALLHDVGKTRTPLSIWERVLIVAAQAMLPRKTAVWGQGEARGWKRPFVVKAQHPAWGAEMAQNAGSSPLTVSLIQRHQDKLPPSATAVTDEDTLLHHLQWADNQN